MMKRKKGFIDTKNAFNIIRQISSNKIAKEITFHILGEPMLHKDIFKIIGFSKRHRCAGYGKIFNEKMKNKPECWRCRHLLI